MNKYGIEAMKQEQAHIHSVSERLNIRRLQQKADDATAELREAQLRRQNRVMNS